MCLKVAERGHDLSLVLVTGSFYVLAAAAFAAAKGGRGWTVTTDRMLNFGNAEVIWEEKKRMIIVPFSCKQLEVYFRSLAAGG